MQYEVRQTALPQSTEEAVAVSDKKRLLTTILCAAFGIFGAHRFYVGKTKTGRLLFVVFTIRENRVRIISARDVNKKEVHLYEEKA